MIIFLLKLLKILALIQENPSLEIKSSEIPITTDGKPMKISLIITPKEKEPKSLKEILLNPNETKKETVVEKGENTEIKKLASDLKNLSAESQKISESLIKMAKDSEKQTDLINYHVIEITDNKDS